MGDDDRFCPVEARAAWVRRFHRRMVVRFAIVIAAWYAAVGMFLPNIGSSSPTLPFLIREDLRQHTTEVCRGEQRFGNLLGSPVLNDVVDPRRHLNRYHIQTLPCGSSAPSVLIAFPDRASIPQSGLLSRILFLDRRRLHYSAYLLKSDGTLWQHSAEKIDARHPPTDDILGNVGSSSEWTKLLEQRIHPPCE